MKRLGLLWVLSIALFALAPSAVWAAQNQLAQVQLHCLSVRFQPANGLAGSSSSFMLTTDSTGVDLNGELAPLPSGSLRTHGSFFALVRENQRSDGFFYLDVPNSADTNTNGVPDFFEVDLPVAEVMTTGSFEGADASGKVTAVWQREAKSREGTCRVTLDGLNLAFAHKFQLMEYTGALPYRNVGGETNVTTFVTLTQKGTTLTLSGIMVFSKLGGGRLGLQSGAWKDAKAATIAFHSIEEFEREGNDYRAPLPLQDGDPTTRVEDYVSWLLRIVDRNDANGNGIPDLSDEGGQRLPPLLSLSLSGTNVLLTISGEIGRLHQVESILLLGLTNWTLVTNVTLSSDPQTLSLLVPATSITTNVTVASDGTLTFQVRRIPSRAAFWRVKVP